MIRLHRGLFIAKRHKTKARICEWREGRFSLAGPRNQTLWFRNCGENGPDNRTIDKGARIIPRRKNSMMNSFLVISSYKFFRPLGVLREAQSALKSRARSSGLKGTVILAPEGINVSIAGLESAIEDFVELLECLTGSGSLWLKKSWTERAPFSRMLVKVKSHIVPLEGPSAPSTQDPESFIDPFRLKAWFDDEKEFTLLDARNAYEVKVGAFKGAKDLRLRRFKNFESRINKNAELNKRRPIVIVCTGGIRCEKAYPVMKKAGFDEVYQLKGGIVNYFEKVGGAYFEGDCFVFDKRVALNSSLKESDVVECFSCRSPVSPEEQTLESYQVGVCCPHCAETKATEAMHR